MTSLITVTSKNQVTLPMAMVEKLGIRRGSKLFVRMDGDSLKLEKTGDSLSELQGFLADSTIAKKNSMSKIMKIAAKKRALRIMNETK